MTRMKQMAKALVVLGMAACPAAAQLTVNMESLSALKKNEMLTRTQPALQKPAMQKGVQFVKLGDVVGQRLHRADAPATRALKPVAYYMVESGVYTMVPGMSMTEDTYTDNGFLAPLNVPVKYEYAHTGTGGYPVHYEWLLGDAEDDIVIGTSSAEKVYTPYVFTGNISTITPELYVLNEASAEDSYSAGTLTFSMSDGSVQEFRGMVSLSGAGWVYNMDVDAYPGLSSSILYVDDNDIWGSVFFGTETQYQSAYVELYEAPKGGWAAVQGSWIPVVTPADVDLQSKTFNLAYAEAVNGQLTVKSDLAVTGENIIKVGVDTENNIAEWMVLGILDSIVQVNDVWAVLIQGPQDGTKWAMKTQIDRLYDENPLNDELVTTKQLLMSGEYAGYMADAVQYTTSANETKVYPVSLDMYTFVALPWMSVVIDTEEGSFLVQNDTLPTFSADGGTAPAILASWNTVAGLKVTSDASWLTCTTAPFKYEDGQVAEILLEISVTAEPIPAGVEGRKANLTFTDEWGYTQVLTVIQGEAAAGIGSVVVGAGTQMTPDPNAPIYDLTGREVKNPTSGIYLQNGKKFVVK